MGWVAKVEVTEIYYNFRVPTALTTVFAFVCVFVFVCLFVCVCVCSCVFVFVFVYVCYHNVH